MNLSDNKILITGGASGIGLGLTERFVRENNTVIICGRRAEVLREVEARFPSVVTRVCDLAVAEERLALFEWIRREHSDLNVLVNNAGIQQWMSPADADFPERSRVEIAINIEAPLHLTHLFLQLPAFTTLLNVSSGLAFVPLAKVPVYSATKAFIHSYTLSLRALLKGRNIEVIEVIPPALNTDLGGKGLHDHFPPVGGFIESVFEQLAQGRQEITYGYSQEVTSAGPEELRRRFAQMNPGS